MREDGDHGDESQQVCKAAVGIQGAGLATPGRLLSGNNLGQSGLKGCDYQWEGNSRPGVTDLRWFNCIRTQRGLSDLDPLPMAVYSV